jgi:hypothetical protein
MLAEEGSGLVQKLLPFALGPAVRYGFFIQRGLESYEYWFQMQSRKQPPLSPFYEHSQIDRVIALCDEATDQIPLNPPLGKGEMTSLPAGFGLPD